MFPRHIKAKEKVSVITLSWKGIVINNYAWKEGNIVLLGSISLENPNPDMQNGWQTSFIKTVCNNSTCSMQTVYYCSREIRLICLIPKGTISQMLAALCDINQTHLCGNTCIRHMRPSLLCTSGEDLSACRAEKFPTLAMQVRTLLCMSEAKGLTMSHANVLMDFYKVRVPNIRTIKKVYYYYFFSVNYAIWTVNYIVNKMIV